MSVNKDFAKRALEILLLRHTNGIAAVEERVTHHALPIVDETIKVFSLAILSFYPEGGESISDEVRDTVHYLKEMLENHILTGNPIDMDIDLQGNASLLLQDTVDIIDTVEKGLFMNKVDTNGVFDKEFITQYLQNVVECYKNGTAEMKGKLQNKVGDNPISVGFTYTWQNRSENGKITPMQLDIIKRSMVILLTMITSKEDIEQEFGVDLGEWKEEILQETFNFAVSLIGFDKTK